MMTTGAGAGKPGIRVPPEFLYIERGVHILELDNAPAEAVFETYYYIYIIVGNILHKRIDIGEFSFKF